MIARLKGTVVEHRLRGVVVDVRGVGYAVSVTAAARQRLAVGRVASLRIYHHVGAGEEALFGFMNSEELEYFQLLLAVPSVGPRTALNILEVAPPRTLAQAVVEADMALLTKVSGVGRKTAERILVELKGKVSPPGRRAAPGAVQEEALDALVTIGFTAGQARSALRPLPPTIKTVEEAVRWVLQRTAQPAQSPARPG